MVNPNEDTEFNDALRAHGILPPKPPSRSPSPDIPHITHQDAVGAIAATADHQQLSLLLESDNLDDEDEAMFESYRKKRMEEMRKEEKRGRFGTVMPLGREDFVREVTEGSMMNADGVIPEEITSEMLDDDDDEERGEGSGRQSRGLRGTGVVVFLYKDSVPLSQHLRPLLSTLASAHPSSKFLAIRADLCIPNYPDKNVPTLLVYRDGEMLGQIVAGAGMRGMKTNVKDLESLLLRYQALEKPSAALRSRGREEDNDGGEDGDGLDDDIGMVNTRGSSIRTGGGLGTGKSRIGAGRRKEADSDGSDFDI